MTKTCFPFSSETKSAVEEMTKFSLNFILRSVKAAKPSDTAQAIVEGGATRQKEVFYPYYEAKTTMLRDLIPETYAAINRYMYSRDG